MRLRDVVFPARPADSEQRRGSSSKQRNAWRGLKEGIRFMLSKKVILATITLDMFAVLLGGATALLPIFADQILHCGPIGLGWLRAAPGVGAFIMALFIAYLPPMKHAGKTLLWCVTGFGLVTIFFGFLTYLWLSLAMLFLLGVFDSVSVVVRHTLLQLTHARYDAWPHLRREQHLHRNIERTRGAGVGIDRGAFWSGDFRCRRRSRNNTGRAGCRGIWPETRKIGTLDKICVDGRAIDPIAGDGDGGRRWRFGESPYLQMKIAVAQI